MAETTKKQSQKAKKEQRRREITGVCLIALGLFLGVGIYSDAVGIVGTFISDLIFGLVGLMGYAIAPVLAAGGVAYIVSSKSKPGKGRASYIVLFMVLLLSVIHISVRSVISETTFLVYCKDAYVLGQAQFSGGGVIGALLAYVGLLLIGEAGSYIIFIAGMLVILLVVTKLSIRSAGEKVGETIAYGIQTVSDNRARRKALYTETLADDDLIITAPPSKKKRESFRSDYDDDSFIQPARKQNRDEMDELEYMPTRGPLTKNKRDPKDPFGFDEVVPPADDWIEPAPINTSTTLNTRVKIEKPSVSRGTKERTGTVINSAADLLGINEKETFRPDPEPFPAMPFAGKLDTDTPANMQGFEAASFTAEADPDIIVPQTKPKSNVRRIRPKAPAERVTHEQAAEPIESITPTPADAVVYQRPPYSLLKLPEHVVNGSGESPNEKAKLLIETLASFNITARLLNVSVGPVITRFELAPAQGVRVNRITALSDDIALALAAPRVRIEAPIPGKAAIGVEVPNKNTATVLLREVVESPEFNNAKSPLTFALGKDIAGNIAIADLDKMPHMLIAGATGAGKSVCINGIILSLIYRSSPADLRLILVDPKVVELRMFSALPHLLVPVVTEPKKAAGALRWAVMEMEQRYQKMAKGKVRSLAGYNAMQTNPDDKMPKIVIVIDELADLMMVASKDVEEAICRIAQLGRACGIHLIVATQRPSADIITGLIKANIPSRIAFAVSSAIDSRVIMDASGAEKLLGRGDMLFHANGAGKPVRIQGSFVSDDEVERVTDFFLQQQTPPVFDDQVLDGIENSAAPAGAQAHGEGKQEDELLPEAVKIVLESGQASISMIQRRLRVGYARAARLIDIMEQKHIVSGFDGSKPRKLLIDQAQYAQMFSQQPAEEDENDE